MDMLAAIESRVSAKTFAQDPVSAQDVDRILAAAVRAPDHGRLSPWRFVVIEGEGREAFGAKLAETLKLRKPDAPADMVEAEAAKAMRAPVIVAVGAQITPGKIPEIEQVAAVAAAIQNMQLAAAALGLGAVWKTGAPAYDPTIKAWLGLAPQDHIVGFVYIGRAATTAPRREQDAAAYTRRIAPSA